MRVPMRKAMALGALALAMSSAPASAVIGCQGKVNQVTIEPNGDTYVHWGSWSTRFCSAGQTITIDRGPGGGGGSTINPSTCQSLTAIFLTAKALGQEVVVYIDKTSCQFSGGYENPHPYYYHFLP